MKRKARNNSVASQVLQGLQALQNLVQAVECNPAMTKAGVRTGGKWRLRRVDSGFFVAEHGTGLGLVLAEKAKQFDSREEAVDWWRSRGGNALYSVTPVPVE